MNIYILQIDTSTEVCSVSLSFNGLTVSSIEASEPNLHASHLTVLIDKLLHDSAVNYSDLSAVCVGKGPGSYTGLRIGVSTAKGLCYALDIPLLAINTLDMMYLGCKKDASIDSVYIPMLDARRMEVYMKIFDQMGTQLEDTEARIIESNSFDKYSGRSIVLFGSGAGKLEQLFESNSSICIDSDFVHSSSYMSSDAFLKYLNGDFEDLVYFEPFYLKEFIALMPKKVI